MGRSQFKTAEPKVKQQQKKTQKPKTLETLCQQTRWVLWLMSAILAMLEVEARGLWSEDSPRQK
jgi:hypothetical protein